MRWPLISCLLSLWVFQSIQTVLDGASSGIKSSLTEAPQDNRKSSSSHTPGATIILTPIRLTATAKVLSATNPATARRWIGRKVKRLSETKMNAGIDEEDIDENSDWEAVKAVLVAFRRRKDQTSFSDSEINNTSMIESSTTMTADC